MPADLFRPEVMERKGQTWLGHIVLKAPRAGWVFAGVSALTIAAVAIGVAFAQVTSYERAGGTLVPSDGLLSVVHTEQGRVARVLVEEGSHVSAGQAIMVISSETHSTFDGETHAVISEQIALKRKHLLQDGDDNVAMAKAKRQELLVRDALLQSQARQVDQKLHLEDERAKNATQLYEQWSKVVSRGLISKVQLLEQQNTALEYQAQVKDLAAQLLEIQQQREALQGELTQLPLDSRHKQSDLQRQLADLTEDQIQNEAKRVSVIRAPADGMVTSIFVHQGDAITPQETLINVLPTNSTLLAELWVPPRSIGMIRPGERVTIRYKAFPFQRFGQYEGHVLSVSGSAVAANDITRLTGQVQGEAGPQYRVRVQLKSQSVMFGRKEEPLIPGLTLDADIVLEHRRISSWLFPSPSMSSSEPGYADSRGNHG